MKRARDMAILCRMTSERQEFGDAVNEECESRMLVLSVSSCAVRDADQQRRERPVGGGEVKLR